MISVCVRAVEMGALAASVRVWPAGAVRLSAATIESVGALTTTSTATHWPAGTAWLSTSRKRATTWASIISRRTRAKVVVWVVAHVVRVARALLHFLLFDIQNC